MRRLGASPSSRRPSSRWCQCSPARDCEHAIALIEAGIGFQIRGTFESAISFSERALVTIGAEPEAAAEIIGEVRKRDAERLEIETVGGIYAGRSLIRGNAPHHAAHGDNLPGQA